MKKSSLLAFLFICTISMSMKPTNDEVKWMNFNDGYKQAKKSGKIMLIDVYTDWCGWCKRMDKDTYAKPEIAGLINEDYVAVKFNPEEEGTYTFEGKEYNGQELAAAISSNQLSGYPTTIFYYPKTQKNSVVGGYLDAGRFQNVLSQVKSQFQPAPAKAEAKADGTKESKRCWFCWFKKKENK